MNKDEMVYNISFAEFCESKNPSFYYHEIAREIDYAKSRGFDIIKVWHESDSNRFLSKEIKL